MVFCANDWRDLVPATGVWSRRIIRIGHFKGIFGNVVPEVGLEPTRLAAEDFESSASTIPPLGHGSSLTPAPERRQPPKAGKSVTIAAL